MGVGDSTQLAWTRSRLEKERNDWWDTQVTGSQEVWGAIRLAVQSLQAGKLRDAQGWLETMECTCPTGCLWKGVYDSTGVLYKLPEWLVVEPEGLVPDTTDGLGEDGPAGGGAAAAAAGTDDAQDDEDEDEDDEPMLVRARISRTGRDVTLKLRRKEQVASIVQKIKEHAEVCSFSLYISPWVSRTKKDSRGRRRYKVPVQSILQLVFTNLAGFPTDYKTARVVLQCPPCLRWPCLPRS